MFFFFTPLLLAFSSDLIPFYDIILDFKSLDLFLFVNDDFIQVRDSLKQNSNILYTKNFNDNSISLNIAVTNLNNLNHKLYIVSSISKKLNICSNITNIDQNNSTLELYFLTETSKIKNTLYFSFYIYNPDFIILSNFQPNINIKVISSIDNRIITQILQETERNNFIICYEGKECQKRNEFSIDLKDNYLTSINDHNFEKIFNELFSSTSRTTFESISLFFSNEKSPKIDFSFIPFDRFQNVHIFGHSQQNPQQIILTNKDHIKLISKWKTQNVSFLTEAENLNNNLLSFYDINPKKSSSISVSALTKLIFPVNLNFNNNKFITLEIKQQGVTIYNQKKEEIDRIDFIRGTETVLLIENEKSTTFENTIFIKPNTFIDDVNSRNITLKFEGCGNMSIEFLDWQNKIGNLDYVMFNFIINGQENLNFTSSKDRRIKYRYYNETSKESFTLIDEYPKAFVFCSKSEYCENVNNLDKDPVLIIDENPNIKGIFDEIAKKTTENITFLIDKEDFDSVDLSCLIGTNLTKVAFISSAEKKDLKIVNLPYERNISTQWTITNCSITVEEDNEINGPYIIDELYSTYSEIVGKNVIINHGTYLMKKDLVTDINVSISSSIIKLDGKNYNHNDILTLEITNKEDESNSFIFQIDDFNEEINNISLNIMSINENYKDIPVSFKEPEKKCNDFTIYISVNSTEHIIFKSLPATFNFVVNSKELNKTIQQVYCDADNIWLSYETDKWVPNEYLEKSTTFISAKTKDNYNDLIESINGTDKNYTFLRLIFFDSDGVINLAINDIPKKFEQIQLYGYDNDNILLLLENNSDTTRFKNWEIYHISFAQNTNITFSFDVLTINNTESVFDNPGSNIIINTTCFYCKHLYITNGLNNVNNIDKIRYELFDEFDKDNYTLSTKMTNFYANSNLENGNGNPIIRPKTENFDFIFHTPQKQNYTFYIYRQNATKFNSISIEFEDVQNIINVQYECQPNQFEESFTYNFKIKNDEYLRTNQGSCQNVETMINGKNAPISTPAPTPVYTEFFSKSSFFSLSNPFTFSKMFTNSEKFTKTGLFSKTDLFSDSNQFTKSSDFSLSFQFSPSDKFSKTAQFSGSSLFSETSLFSCSSKFSHSDQFSKSLQFSKSFIFSETDQFTKTEPFSSTNAFSFTFDFTLSSIFSVSSPFSKSDYFPSVGFTESIVFTKSSFFTKSSTFSSSFTFTQSSQFTPSFPLQINVSYFDDAPSLNTSASFFNLNSVGFTSDNNDDTDLSSYDSSSINIVFDSPDIKITESDEFSLSTMMYFVANRTGSSITIGKKLKNSVIGVKTDNNPRLILENTDNPLNIKNYKRGYSLMDIEYANSINTKNIDIVLRELNNSNGYLTLNVDQRIRSISFTSLIIDRISSLQARHRNERLNTLLLDDNDDDNDEDIVKIIVRNDININEESEATLTKVELKGILNLYDDSLLTFKKETIFDQNSIINISFINSKDSRQEPIIKFDGVIDSTPSKIVINFGDKSQSSDLSNYVIFEVTKFKKCLTWIDKFEFVNKDKNDIEARCEYAEHGLTHLILSNPKKKKLNIGAIVGIVIGCVAVVGIIIAIIILLIVSKTKNIAKVHDEGSASHSSDDTF